MTIQFKSCSMCLSCENPSESFRISGSDIRLDQNQHDPVSLQWQSGTESLYRVTTAYPTTCLFLSIHQCTVHAAQSVNELQGRKEDSCSRASGGCSNQ